MLSVVMLNVIAEYRYADAECRYAECLGASF
jgi:hypothetical protein